MLAGDNGILTRTTDAKEKSDIAQIQEEIGLAWNAVQVDGITKGWSNQEKSDALETELKKEYASAATTLNGTNIDVTYKGYETTINTETGGMTALAKARETPVTPIINPENSGTVLSIPNDLDVGSTVSWTPHGSYINRADYYASDSSYSDQYFASGQDYTELSEQSGEDYIDMTISSWKVLSVDKSSGIVRLVPTRSTGSGTLRIEGAQGYNNMPKILNDACDSLYGDSEHGITARSIKIEDYEEILDPTHSQRNMDTYYDGSYNNYPEVWAQQDGCTIGGNPVSGPQNLGISDSPTENGQTVFIGRTHSSDTFSTVGAITSEDDLETSYISDFGWNIESLSNEYSSLKGNNDNFFVASRQPVGGQDSCIYFGFFYVSYGRLSNVGIYDSSDICCDFELGLFPIVTITKGTFTGDNTNGFTFSV